MSQAVRIVILGVVQGVGFRPFVYRLARASGITGFVLNAGGGVEIHAEGSEASLKAFIEGLRTRHPPAAKISGLDCLPVFPRGYREFSIHKSEHQGQPTTGISPDLAVCDECLKELFDPRDRRYHYPYINCVNCGPRFSIIEGLPYDRPRTTMKAWAWCRDCERQYHDQQDRRFHAQPIACPECGPHYYLQQGDEKIHGDEAAIQEAARLMREGKIIALKGVGGYHLACDARNPEAVRALRERKYRKEKPFAVMVEKLESARELIELSLESESLLTSPARPIVLAKAKESLPGVAPENTDLGVMVSYTPLHYLLFHYGAPEVLVMTSANRSSEPIAFSDQEALASLSGIADAFLIGERPIARRVEDSVVQQSAFSTAFVRRSRGFAPAVAAKLPAKRPILAVGADLKNTVTLVVDGQAFLSQYLGDLEHLSSYQAFQETITDFLQMYRLKPEELIVAHDSHPEYRSTVHALSLAVNTRFAVQHHRSHVAAVLAEHGLFEKRVIGVAFDGTGYGDDGAIWGGEFFVGSLEEGFARVGHLRYSALPGGDAAARFPVQAAAGFLFQLEELPDLSEAPFNFPRRYFQAREMLQRKVRTFSTSSVGRLFDTVAALLGFTREVSYEGQAAIWLEQLARRAANAQPYVYQGAGLELDFRPVLKAIVLDRIMDRDPAAIAHAFHVWLASAINDIVRRLGAYAGVDTVCLSGGVFQNTLLLATTRRLLEDCGVEVLTPRMVPPNDGGISLGQACLACFVPLEQSAG